MQEKEPAQIVRHGNLEININNYDVRINGKRLNLTPKEAEIFQLLASHPGKVFTRQNILATVWGYDYYGDLRAVDVAMRRCGHPDKAYPPEDQSCGREGLEDTDRLRRRLPL